MIVGLIRAFLWIVLVVAVLGEVLVWMARLGSTRAGGEPISWDQAVEVAFTISAFITLGTMLREAAPLILEPRRRALEHIVASPRIVRYAAVAGGSFFGQACVAFWSAFSQGGLTTEDVIFCALPFTLGVLAIGSCLLLVHFAKLRA